MLFSNYSLHIVVLWYFTRTTFSLKSLVQAFLFFPPTSPSENKFPVILICLYVSSQGRERKINLSAIWIYLRHRRYILAFELQTELIPYMLEAIYLLKNNSAEQFLTKRYASTFYRSSNKIINLSFFIVSLKICIF